MRWLLIPLGAFVGALVVRGFFLDIIEEATFRATWAALDYVKVQWSDVRLALRTDTGQKLALGAALGASGGWFFAFLAGKLSPAPKK